MDFSNTSIKFKYIKSFAKWAKKPLNKIFPYLKIRIIVRFTLRKRLKDFSAYKDFVKFARKEKIYKAICKFCTSTTNQQSCSSKANEIIASFALYMEKDIKSIDSNLKSKFSEALTTIFDLINTPKSSDSKKIGSHIKETTNILKEQTKLLIEIKSAQESCKDADEDTINKLLINIFEYNKQVSENKLSEKYQSILCPIVSYTNEDGTSYTLSFDEFLHKFLKTSSKNLSITGIGGIGKTFTLKNGNYLKGNDSIIPIYIPLQCIHNKDSIMSYIENKILNGNQKLITGFRKYISSPSGNSKIMLILDGLNELSNSSVNEVLKEIRNDLLDNKGLIFIISSRYDLSLQFKNEQLHHIKLNTISKETVKTILNSSPAKESFNYTEQSLDVLNTPLMINLFINKKSSIYEGNPYMDFISLSPNETITSASVIWNYAQSLINIDHRDTNLEEIVAIDFITPYICNYMAEKSVFSLSPNDFMYFIEEALIKLQSLERSRKLPSKISNAKASFSRKFDSNPSLYLDLLLKKLSIFVQENDYIRLIHQNFRDCFVAKYLMTIASLENDIPSQWVSQNDCYILDYLVDFLKYESSSKMTWNTIWNYGYQKNSANYKFTNKMLSIYKKAYGNDISEIDFESVDFKNVPLAGYILHPSDQHFKNAKIYTSTFFGNGHSMPVTSISWNNNIFLSASRDCTVRIYNDNNLLLSTINTSKKGYLRCAKFSPDGNYIATAGDDKNLTIWSKEPSTSNYSSKIIGNCDNWIFSLDWNSSNDMIVCGDNKGQLSIFNINKTCRQNFENTNLASITSLLWLESHDDIFISGSSSGEICFWNTNTRNCIYRKTLDSSIKSIQWLKRNNLLLISTSNNISIYKLSYNQKTNTINLKSIYNIKVNNISFVAVSNNEMDYISIFSNKDIKIIKVVKSHDIIKEQEIALYNYSHSYHKIISAQWNKDCNKLICGSKDGSVLSIDLYEKEEQKERIDITTIANSKSNSARCSAWSPSGKFIAVGYDDCNIRIWSIESKHCVKVLSWHTNSIKCLYWSNNNTLISGSNDGNIVIWSGEEISQYTFINKFYLGTPVNAVLVLSNGIIVSGDDSCNVTFFDNQLNKIIFQNKQHTDRVYALSLSPDNKYIISAGNDKSICVWDSQSYNFIKSFESGHTSPIRALAWSNNNDFIISSSNDNKIIKRMYNSSNGQFSNDFEIVPINHTNFVYSVNISKNNYYIVSGSTDTTVGFWSLKNNKLASISSSHKSFVWNISTCHTENNIDYAASSSSDGFVHIFDLSNPDLTDIKPLYHFEAIPNSNLTGCNFNNAIINGKKLKRLLKINGASL